MGTGTTYDAAIIAPMRQIKARIDLYSHSAGGWHSGTKLATYTGDDKIISMEIQRIGANGKWFGFGICQRLNVHLIDKERALNITTDTLIEPDIGVVLENGTTKWTPYDYGFPIFRVSEVHRDEKTNELSVTAYDYLYQATKYTINDLDLTAPYTIRDVMRKIYAKIGFEEEDVMANNSAFNLSFPNGANFDGSENLRDVLDMIAEATQTIYFGETGNNLAFVALSPTDIPYTIDKSQYFELESKGSRRLQTICSATELGDNVSESTTLVGSTQYVRNNAFWELRDDIATLVHDAITRMGDISIGEFSCKWRGNLIYGIGSKLAITTKDNQTITSYLLNDTIKYDGGLVQETKWEYGDGEEESASNPTSIGEAIKQTYARVDKANKKIELVVSDISNVQDGLADVEKKAELAVTSDEVNIRITNAMRDGATKVTTERGFTFDDDGLTISKDDSDITTNIDEDGMSISKGSTEVLTVDNTGVKARNLHATTYLIVGQHSRFEDYDNRTGCFWLS